MTTKPADSDAPSDELSALATPLLTVGWRVLALFSGLLILLLAVGFTLPGTWSVERSTELEAPPDEVFPYLDELRRWSDWSPWPEIELIYSGPPSGAGAAMAWDDPVHGDGSFRIVESRPDSVLRYSVSVEGGSMVTRGEFRLIAARSEGRPGTRVEWREDGDFGWNPLMAYVALWMDRTQGTELERGLERLAAIAEAR